MQGDAPQDRLTDAFAAVAHEVEAQFYFHYRVDDDDPTKMSLEAAVGVAAAEAVVLRRISIGENLSGGVAQAREPIILQNVHLREDARTARIRRIGVRAYAGFPLLAHGDVFGTIAFASTTQTAFPPADVELLPMLVNQFSVALDRMRLVRRLRDSESALPRRGHHRPDRRVGNRHGAAPARLDRGRHGAVRARTAERDRPGRWRER